MRPASKEELLAQPYIKDGEKTIADLISQATQKFGERTEVADFSCFAVA
jgi:translation elongation factor EF-Ts